MATGRVLACSRCGPSPAPGTLFQTLLACAQGQPQRCPRCGATPELRLKFELGLDADDSECTVRDCFVPKRLESWAQADGSRVTFYPFLIIVQRHGRDLAAWLPYWHVVERAHRSTPKYGQWAPFMDFHLFADLLNQAQAKGYSPEKLHGPRA